MRLKPMTHHRARPPGRLTDVKPLLPEWHRECSRAQAAAPVLAWRCPALRCGLCHPIIFFLPFLDSAGNGEQHCLVRPARMRAHRDEAQEAVMPGAGALGFGGGRHACQVAADRIGRRGGGTGQRPAGSGRGPARQRPDHFGRFDPALGFYQALTKEVTIQAPRGNEASLVPGLCRGDVDRRDR